jgi:hypothetical protein
VRLEIPSWQRAAQLDRVAGLPGPPELDVTDCHQVDGGVAVDLHQRAVPAATRDLENEAELLGAFELDLMSPLAMHIWV